MNALATVTSEVLDITQAYQQGFKDGYAKHKAEMAAKPKRVISPADKKLAEDVRKAMSALNSLERWTPDKWTSVPEAMQEAVNSEMLRLQRAIADPALLWRIYRRKDKGPSYVEVSE